MNTYKFISFLLIILLITTHELDGDYSGQWYTRTPLPYPITNFHQMFTFDTFIMTHEPCRSTTYISNVSVIINIPFIDITVIDSGVPDIKYFLPMKSCLCI